MMDDVIKVKGVAAANSMMLRDLIRYHQIPLYLESGVKEIKDNSVVINTPEGEKEINCDSVILSVGYKAGTPLAEKSEGNVHIIGDADHVANLKAAIWAAYDLAYNF